MTLEEMMMQIAGGQQQEQTPRKIHPEAVMMVLTPLISTMLCISRRTSSICLSASCVMVVIINISPFWGPLLYRAVGHTPLSFSTMFCNSFGFCNFNI